MFNALFLIYFSIVNGVEILCGASRGRPSTRGRWSQRHALGRTAGAPLGLCAPPQEPSLWAPQKRLSSCVVLWNPAPPEDRAPLTCLKDADSVTQGLGDRWRLACSYLARWRVSLATVGAWLQGCHAAASAPSGSGQLVRPTQGNSICVIPLLLTPERLEVFLWSSVLFSSSYVAGKGHKDGKKKVCCGCQPKGQE